MTFRMIRMMKKIATFLLLIGTIWLNTQAADAPADATLAKLANEARDEIRRRKWSEWVAAHQQKTNGVPNQSSEATAKPVSIKPATPNDFKSMLIVASGDGSSRYFIGSAEEWAYCEAKDRHGNVTIYFARKADLDERLLADLGNELRRRSEGGKGKDEKPEPPAGDVATRAAPEK